jgi:hypothetical protein
VAQASCVLQVILVLLHVADGANGAKMLLLLLLLLVVLNDGLSWAAGSSVWAGRA